MNTWMQQVPFIVLTDPPTYGLITTQKWDMRRVIVYFLSENKDITGLTYDISTVDSWSNVSRAWQGDVTLDSLLRQRHIKLLPLDGN